MHIGIAVVKPEVPKRITKENPGVERACRDGVSFATDPATDMQIHKSKMFRHFSGRCTRTGAYNNKADSVNTIGTKEGDGVDAHSDRSPEAAM